MSLPEKLELAWATLEAGRSDDILVRRLDDLGIASGARVGVDDTGARELLFAVAADAVVPAPPAIRGVRVLVRTVRVGAKVDRFLVVRCDMVSAHRVFARFAADLLEQTEHATDVVRRVLEVLTAWRQLFRHESLEPESVARGIFGELDELRRLVAIDPAALHAWRGPAHEPQDFVRGPFALEVKSSRTRPRSVDIHGLDQLWAAPFEALILAVKHIATDPGGESIDDLVRGLLAAGVESDALRELLEPLGLSTDTPPAAVGSYRFRVRETRYFTITPTAPVLTRDSLVDRQVPGGVSDITYSLALDAEGLMATTPELLQRVSEGLARR